MKYLVKTYGCQMNVHESEKLSGMMEALGYERTEDEKGCDVIIFNTCCIRHSAENKLLGNLSILKVLKANNPKLITAVCGCMSQQPDGADMLIKRNPYIDIIFGTHNLHCLGEYLSKHKQDGKQIVDIWDEGGIEEDIPVRREEDGRAWVNIMYGCDNYCSYCIVPFVRGRERSRDFDTVLAEVKGLIKDGVKEITFLGQNVNSYKSEKKDFADLLSVSAKFDGDYTLKFMTSHPKDFSKKLVEVIASSSNIAKEIHLPVQSGSDRILGLMNRKYTRKQYLDLVTLLRKFMPDCRLTTDIIVGFPSETQAEYEETLDLLKTVRFNKLFGFMYSKRTGTSAEKMDNQIPIDTKRKRIKELLDLQKQIEREIL